MERLRRDQHVYMLLGKANKNGEEQWQESPRNGVGVGGYVGHSGSSGLPQGESPSITDEGMVAKVGTGGTRRKSDETFQDAKVMVPGSRSSLNRRRENICRCS